MPKRSNEGDIFASVHEFLDIHYNKAIIVGE